eukprot:scaffold252559_cov30-Prasinocladus_malaysianus.AAC.1
MFVICGITLKLPLFARPRPSRWTACCLLTILTTKSQKLGAYGRNRLRKKNQINGQHRHAYSFMPPGGANNNAMIDDSLNTLVNIGTYV